MYSEKITKTFEEYGIKKYIFQNFEITLNENEITSIVAPLKNGKTTLLKILTGIEPADNNFNIIPNSFLITSQPMSFPWMSLKQTLQFANPKISADEIKNISSIVGLEGYEEHIPNNKSIGFRFRITIAAALTKNKKVILIDEPFENMEQLTKEEIFQLIISLNNKNKIGFVIATSNLNEAILLSNKIILLESIPHKKSKEFLLNNIEESIQERISSKIYFDNLNKIIEEVKQNNLHKHFHYLL